ncbi:MAG: flagellar hook protein FlgE [Actinobacteria bacterium]|nr:flagellar hook protein FlgE [Actinomycetota bacterium]
MERSLLAAVSGIAANQDYVDVIGNNIANVDTVGYESEQPVFGDLLAEQISGASAPGGPTIGGGINPVAIGSGVRVAAVLHNLTQGSMEQTNQPTDVAINGSGYFSIIQGGTQVYTRAGQFTLDANGNLVTPEGGLVQGWQATNTGTLNTTAPVSSIRIPTGEVMLASETTHMDMAGNLPAWDGTGTPPTITTTIDSYDALGNVVPVTFTYTGVSGTPNEWNMTATVPNGTATPSQLFSTPATITFDPTTGQVSGIAGGGGVAGNSTTGWQVSVNTMPPSPPYYFTTGDTWTVNFAAPGTVNDVTQYANQQTIAAVSQDGNSAGVLQTFTIGQNGVITGSFSNGRSMPVAQVALAEFPNPGGLTEIGNNAYGQSANSGQPLVGTPQSGGRGNLVGGSLEMSNVNLASQLTDLIIAQTDYQANTKVVTTTATDLQSIINMP